MGHLTVGRLTTLKPSLQRLAQALPGLPKAGDKRLRGSAAVTRRAKYLRLHPLCVMCEREGKVTAGDVVDHIVPLWKGGPDDYEANGQSLCRDHHDRKSKTEAAERARGA